VISHDLSLPITPTLRIAFGQIDYILNIASESHVDRSLIDPVPFVRNNVELMLNMLEYARVAKPRLFLQMSTDEVFGPAPVGYAHHEWDAIKPSNPYSASKAAQEALAYSYWRGLGVPVVLTNTMNLIGPAPQDPEKYLPRVARAVLRGESLPVHASPEGVSGSRCWLDVRDFADAWLFLIRRLDGDITVPYYPTMPPELHRFNIVGNEATNLELAQTMARIVAADLKFQLVDYHASRPGHDHRYALDGTKMNELGWRGPRPLDESLRDIASWYSENPEWLESSWRPASVSTPILDRYSAA
jgi:dTDP-glucose 4,6-dehydratase